MKTQSWTIGSEPACDIVVENTTVSGQHCRLVSDGSVFKLEDLNSTNGTFVNGELLKGTKNVSKDDHITLGKTHPMPWPGDDDGSQGLSNEADNLPQVITIGRASGNTLVIDESNVSSVHAQLTISKDQIVVEDLGSTNGTSVGTIENKINRATVQPGDTLFFGSTAYAVSDLIAKSPLSAATQVRQTEPPTNPGKPAKPKPVSVNGVNGNSKLPMAIGLAAAGGLLLCLAIWAVIANQNSDSNDLADSDSPSNKNSNIEDVKPDPGTNAESVEPDKKVTTPPSDPNPDVVSDADKLSRSLFLVICSDSNGDTAFRVGTAFAIDAKHVATSASVIAVMRDVQKNGFPNAKLYNPQTKSELKIVSSRVHPQYETANTEARLAQQKHDEILEELNSKEPDPAEIEAAKEPLLAARMTAMEALELQTTCDVGVIEVDQPLDHWLAGDDGASSLRPKLKLNVTGFAIDVLDPFFDKKEIKLSRMPSRVNQVFKWSKNSLQRLAATGSDDQFEYSYLGSPAINEQGQVVAVYSRPIPTDENEESENTNSTGAFDAPLFKRVSECLEKHP